MNTNTFALSSSSSSPPHKSHSRMMIRRGHQTTSGSGGNQIGDPFKRRSARSALASSRFFQKIMMQNNEQQQNIKFKSKPFRYVSYRLLSFLHKTFQKEEKIDELDLMLNELGAQEFIYRRQQEIDVLCRKTSFTKKEIKLLYWGWKISCPDGILNEFIFKEIYAQFFPQAGDSSLYARNVFNAMFAETLAKNNQITFTEYIKALSMLCRGSLNDKIKWIFTLYDTNRDGRITYDEVFQMSVAVYSLLGYNVKPMHNMQTYEEHAKKVFQKLDPNNLGYVTFEQFKEVCEKNETIIKSMQQLDTEAL